VVGGLEAGAQGGDGGPRSADHDVGRELRPGPRRPVAAERPGVQALAADQPERVVVLDHRAVRQRAQWGEVGARAVGTEPVGVQPAVDVGGTGRCVRMGPRPGRLEALVVPVPALAIIQTIDADIQCDGNDADRMDAFGENVRKAIQLVVDASPNGRVLVVGQLGRPRAAFLEELIAKDPSQRDALTGTGRCDFFDPSGALDKDHIANLTAIIDAFETEEAKVCAEFTQCATDGGVRAAYIDELENFSSDWNHLNVRGQAAEAELIWPVVQELLGQ